MQDNEETSKQTPVHCDRCGRVLTDPESIKIRLGPVCFSKIETVDEEAFDG